MVKHGIKLTIIAVLISNSSTFFAASGKDKQTTKSPKQLFVSAIYSKDLASIKQLLEQGKLDPNQKINGDPLIFNAINGSPEIIELLLNAGARIDVTSESGPATPLDWAYGKFAALPNYTKLVLPNEAPDSELMSLAKDIQKDKERKAQLKKIIEKLLDAGATRSLPIPTDNSSRENDIKKLEEESYKRRAQQTQEMFDDSQLARPLPKAIIQTQIADYLGVPANEQRQERERIASEEEEKEKSAASTSKTTPATAAAHKRKRS
jgi:hypothetical protein